MCWKLCVKRHFFNKTIHSKVGSGSNAVSVAVIDGLIKTSDGWLPESREGAKRCGSRETRRELFGRVPKMPNQQHNLLVDNMEGGELPSYALADAR